MPCFHAHSHMRIMLVFVCIMSGSVPHDPLSPTAPLLPVKSHAIAEQHLRIPGERVVMRAQILNAKLLLQY